MKQENEIKTMMVAPSELHPLPHHEEFFPDLEGKEYERLKRSIKEDGVIQPIMVTHDMTIICGHQRWRAAKELGLEMIRVTVNPTITDERSKYKALIDGNLFVTPRLNSKSKAWDAYVRMFGDPDKAD